jgi:hypothetical protein
MTHTPDTELELIKEIVQSPHEFVNRYTSVRVVGWLSHLLELLEIKESEYQSAIDKVNVASKLAREYQEENKQLRESFEYACKAIYTQHCTMNHMENTDHEKGQISGLIQASNIIHKAFSQLGEQKGDNT